MGAHNSEADFQNIDRAAYIINPLQHVCYNINRAATLINLVKNVNDI